MKITSTSRRIEVLVLGTIVLSCVNIFACRAAVPSAVSVLSVTPAEKKSHSTHRALAFGDYAEVPDTCPAKTTCPKICAADEVSCPTKCDDGLNLCADGTCSSIPCDDSLVSPCECETASFACAKIITFQPDCYPAYQKYYKHYDNCIWTEAEEFSRVSFNDPWFLACYFWISLVTVLVTSWCSYNQIISPVADSTKSLTSVSAAASPEDAHEWTQTGYKKHFVGSAIYFLVVLTLIGIQFLLFLTTVFYYMQQEAITRWEPVFYDAEQVLVAFELVWTVGIIWSLAFKWPQTIESLFLRRCTLDQATHVAVVAPIKAVMSVDATSKSTYGESLSRLLWCPFEAALYAYFAYPRAPLGHETILCEVDKNTRSFYCRMGRYTLSDSGDEFVPCSIVIGKTIGEFLDLSSGLTQERAQEILKQAGPNIVTIAKPTLLGSIRKEFSLPFYTYQNFIIWTWFNFWYYHMALIATFVRVLAGVVVGVFQYKCDSVLYKLSQVEGSVEIVRSGKRVLINAPDIVPGDIMVLKHGMAFCDLVVIESEHLVVDESVITGEATPVAKSKLDSGMRSLEYNEVKHKQHTIYAGSNIIETGEEDLGLVIATGSATKKGQLLSDILSYQRHKFQFDDEVNVVFLILVLEAIVLVTLVFQFLGGDRFVYAWFYSVYVMATICPPLLGTVFVVSVGISANRLQSRRITCNSSEAILVAGKVNLCCFDKTGTLTLPTMTPMGIEVEGDEELEKKALLGMAVCHNLKVLKSGEIVGNEVDRASFEFSNATITFDNGDYIQVNHNGNKYTILKQYAFDNHSATQSVIITLEDGRKQIYVKGSPESVRSLCRKESIPVSLDDTLDFGSKAGMYQLAIACRDYDLDKDVTSVKREEIESSLSFCGILKFRNELKTETKSVMNDLHAGNILMTMITGDHVNTGIRVARECGICRAQHAILGYVGANGNIDWINVDTNQYVHKPMELADNIDLAVTGAAWFRLLTDEPEYARVIAKYVRVFGRCNPVDKVSIVSTLVQLGYITLMCGDGQNDCGALKAAQIGIALSSSDASVVAPFTSLDKTVTSVTEVLKEGRCALSSALKVYSFYMMYGQIVSMMQVMSTYFYIEFSDWTWIFLDGIYSITLSFALPLAHAAKTLTPCRPTASLFGPRTMISICGMLAWNIFFLVIGMYALFQQDWFQCRMWDSENAVLANADNYESTVIALIGSFQILSTGIALNFGYTFRAAWHENYRFVFFVTTWTIFQFIVTLYPSSFSCIWRINCENENVVRSFFEPKALPIDNPYNTTLMPVEFRQLVALLMVVNLVVLVGWEYYFVNGFLYRMFSFGKDLALDPTQFEVEVMEKVIQTKEKDLEL